MMYIFSIVLTSENNTAMFKIKAVDIVPKQILETILPVVQVTAVGILDELNTYLRDYSAKLLQHFETEVEIQLKNKSLTPASQITLDELEVGYNFMQYENVIKRIITPWLEAINGQPLKPYHKKMIKLSSENWGSV